MIVVSDIETNRLINPDKIWCIVCKEYPSGAVRVFRLTELAEFVTYAKNVKEWVFHNGISFDIPQINRLLGLPELPVIDAHCVTDTLLCSRLLNYAIEGGHSLAQWGTRLGFDKLPIEDFSEFREEIIDRCTGDVEITYRLYQRFKRYLDSPDWQPSIRLEHDAAILALEMSSNGFPYDFEGSQFLAKQFKETLAVLDEEITSAFKPKVVFVREITPTLTKSGTLHRKDFKWLAPDANGNLDLRCFSADSPFSLIEYEPFNPGSVKQIVERMNAAGWRPTEKTKTHIEVERAFKRERNFTKRKELKGRLDQLKMTGWKVSEENLLTVPDTAPAATKKLRDRLIIARRLSTLEEWQAAYRPETKCVHGVFNTIGCWTHRFSHVGPNFANIVSTDKPFGPEMRGLWRVEEGEYLVDVDADGIQLRVLAHYMDDPGFTAAMETGDSKQGTDAHTLNMKALGDVCQTRADAKTFIYSWLLGAGEEKTSQVLSCSLSEAREARANFENFYPGLKRLKRVIIPQDASRGFFVGLDKRKVVCDSEHKMLSGYLQNGESIIMKEAWRIANRKLRMHILEGSIRFVNFVHDEFVLVAKSLELAEIAKHSCSAAIVEAGEVLGTKCRMKGNGKIGRTWAEVH